MSDKHQSNRFPASAQAANEIREGAEVLLQGRPYTVTEVYSVGGKAILVLEDDYSIVEFLAVEVILVPQEGMSAQGRDLFRLAADLSRAQAGLL